MVTVNTASVAPTSISGTTTICNGSQTILTAVGGTLGTGANYQWGTGTTVGTSPISGQTASTLTITPGSSTTYWVRIENTTSPCSATTGGVTQLVTVNQKSGDPTSATAGLAAICNGDSTTLTLNGGGGGTGEIIKWYTDSCGGTLAGTGNGLSVSPTTTTTYYGRYEDGTPCNYNSACSSVTITVNQKSGDPTSATAGLAAICNGDSTTLTLNGGGGGTGEIIKWYTDSCGGTLAGTGNGLSVSPTTTTTYYGRYEDGTPCNYNSNCSSVTVTVNQLPTITASLTTAPTCLALGVITVSNPLIGPGIAYRIDGGTYNNTTGEFSNIGAGLHTIYVKNGSDCIASTTVNVSVPPAKTWAGTDSDWSKDGNWSPIGVPTSNDCVIIPSLSKQPIISSGVLALANTLQLSSGGTLDVSDKSTLNVTNEIIVTDAGSLKFENNASLLQSVTDPKPNTGSIKYLRTVKQILRGDYVYWSTPVSPQILKGVSPLTSGDKYMWYDGVNSKWIIVSGGNQPMMPGKGYIIRGPQTYSNTEGQRADYTATFEGAPNNGNISGETVMLDKYYLIGNPYPSALKAKEFLDGNPFILGALYFWTHNTRVSLQGAYEYASDDYATYTLTGATEAFIEAPSGIPTGNNNSKPTGFIGAGQAFFARIKPTTESGFPSSLVIKFDNSMRIGGADNSQFFKPGKTSKETAVERNRIWLNLTNSKGAFKQTLVGYVEGATNDYDDRYDGISFDGNDFIDFYSVNNQKKYTIQGRALPFENTDLVPMGYRTTIAGDFTISIDEGDGVFTEQAIYLEDKKTGTVNDLRAANYTFTTTAGTFTDRFVLRYTNKTLGTGDFENLENTILVSVKDKLIKATSTKETIKEVIIFDVSGKLLYDKNKVNATELQISDFFSSNQVLLVKVTLENGYSTTRKIIFK